MLLFAKCPLLHLGKTEKRHDKKHDIVVKEEAKFKMERFLFRKKNHYSKNVRKTNQDDRIKIGVKMKIGIHGPYKIAVLLSRKL